MERPCLRPFLAAAPDSSNPGLVVVWDRLGFTDNAYWFSHQEFACLRMLDGQRTLCSIVDEVNQSVGEGLVTRPFLEMLVSRLEKMLLLDGPHFRQILDDPVRQPRLIGCYPGEADALRRHLRDLFTGPRGAGLPRDTRPDGSLRAALIPHIDYPRGGATYTWGFKEVFEKTAASLFVIIGTSHYSGYRFTLTRKHFQTPLGTALTDQQYIDQLVHHYGPGLFDDEWMAHLPEHSIELEVVFLQYLYEKRRPIRIVPLVVGSFHDCVESGRPPEKTDDIGRMVRTLQAVEDELDEPVCYIISGDLAHIGPKFGDPERVQEPIVKKSRQRDEQILQQAETANPHRFFQVIAEENDARRICGLPPAYTTLAAACPRQGKVLHYDQYVDPLGNESVSFASVAFYQ